MVRYCFVILFLLTSLAFGADYWPTQPGATFHYTDGFDGTRDVVILPGNWPGDFYRNDTIVAAWGECWATDVFQIDASGDIVLSHCEYTCEGFIDPDWIDIEPAIRILDLPLVPGSMATYMVMVNSGADFVSIGVSGPETITTPAGTFETMVLSVSSLSASPYLTRTYWLNRTLGPVRIDDGHVWELERWTGVVANEDMAWGAMKGLFR